MKKIILELKEYRIRIVIAFLGISLATLSDIALPILFANIINSIKNSSGTSVDAVVLPFIKSTGKTMVIVVVLTVIGAIVGNFFATSVSTGLAKKLRSKVFSKVQTFSLLEMNEFSTGSMITRNTNDITQIQQFVGMFIRIFVRSPIIMAGSIFMSYHSNSRLARPLILAVPLIVLVVFLISRFVVPMFTKLQEGIDKINRVLREQISGVRVVRAFVNENHEEKRFDDINRDYTKDSLKTFRLMASMSPLLTIVLNLTIVLVLFLAASDISNHIPIIEGDIVAVIQYVTQILFSFIMLSMIFVLYPRAEASAKRVYELLDKIPSIQDLKVTKTIENGLVGTLEFKNVGFSFPDANKPVLEGINFKIEPGTTTAIIGSTGSGKTALLRLILRFYDVTQGAILMDGVDLRELSQEDIRNRIGYVPQRWQLLEGTIADNIKFGKLDATASQIEDAAKTAQAEEFIVEKENGFDAHVAQGGSNFSGGQKQRLSIARALVKKAEFYLFDDTFSALDAVTDKKLRGSLEENVSGATKIIVSQRVSSISDADQIIVLDSGRIVGKGTHNELLENCKTYGEIAASQFSQEEVAG